MIKKGSLFLLFCMILSGCRTPREYFNRPQVNSCITLEESGYMACNGNITPIPAGLIVPEAEDDYFVIREYYEDKENRLYQCLRFGPRRCQ